MAKFVGTTVKFVEGTASKLQMPEGAKDVQIFDSVQPGFGMRRFAPSKVFPKGKVSYFVKYAVDRRQRRVTLGEVIDGNLKAMRLEASAIRSKARLGTDTVAEAEAKAAAAANIITLSEIIKKYLPARESEWASWLRCSGAAG
jgi:hypothetical protein